MGPDELLLTCFLINSFTLEMKPNRPSSAKSGQTKLTIDSDHLTADKDLNSSKFSQTFSAAISANNQNSGQFENYLSEKEKKNPEYKKKHPDLPTIPEGKRRSELNSKPFEKKHGKVQFNSKRETILKKEQQPPLDESRKIEQKEMNSSKTFAERNKEKMTSLKVPPQSEKETEQKNKKVKISFTGFTVSKVGKPKEKKESKEQKETGRNKQVKKENGSNIKTTANVHKKSEEQQRREELLELSRFVEDREVNNVELIPANYYEFAKRNHETDIQKINLDEYLPSERDFNRASEMVDELDEEIMREETIKTQSNQQDASESIDLDSLIDSSYQSEQALNGISTSELRNRNLFVTEILKGRISREQLEELKQMDQSAVKMFKQLESQKDWEEDSENIEIMEISMRKKKHGRIEERNLVEATGELYRDCDYMTPEQLQRIDELLSGNIGKSPFELDEEELTQLHQIEDSLKKYRQFADDIEGDVLNEAVLPKDPALKKEAINKILKQKMSLVNAKFRTIDCIAVSKAKIDALVQNYKDTELSQQAQELLLEKHKEFQLQQELIGQAYRILTQSTQKKGSVNASLEKIREKYIELEREVAKIRAMDEEDIRKLELEEAKAKRRDIHETQHLIRELESEELKFAETTEELKRQVALVQEICSYRPPTLVYDNYHEGETSDEIDMVLTERWEQAEKLYHKFQESEDAELNGQ